MKLSFLSLGLLALLTPLTAAWSKEDREIFRIRDEISAHETDPDATFYDILGISPSASQDDINKAYRKKTRSLHPDKVTQQIRSEHTKASKKDGAAKAPSRTVIEKAVQEASDRQARLSLIANILRGPGRDRYDHFVTYGFPLWKGTDYYYNRYRPGFGTVLVGVFLIGGGAIHYLALYMSWKRQTEFIGRYIRFARDTAWGGNSGVPGIDAEPVPAPAPVQEEDGLPQPTNRRQRRMQEKEAKKESGRGGRKKALKSQSTSASASREGSTGPTGRRKRVVAENGKVLVVDSIGNVYLEGEDEDGNVHEFLLDLNELPKPSIKDTAVVRVPIWLFNVSVGRLLPQKDDVITTEIEIDDEDSDTPQHTPTTDSAGEDFEILESTDSLTKAKTTGSQQQGKANKRKGRKR